MGDNGLHLVPFIGPVLPKHEMHPAFAQYLAPTVTERRKADPKTIEGAMAVVDRKLGLTGDRRKSVMTYLLGGGPVVSPLRLEQAIHLAENNKYDIIEDWNDEYRKNKRIGLPAPSRTAEQTGNPLLDSVDEINRFPRVSTRRKLEQFRRENPAGSTIIKKKSAIEIDGEYENITHEYFSKNLNKNPTNPFPKYLPPGVDIIANVRRSINTADNLKNFNWAQLLP